MVERGSSTLTRLPTRASLPEYFGIEDFHIMLSGLPKHFNTIWLVVVVIVLGLLLMFPGWLNRESISDYLNNLGAMALLVYIGVSLTRSMLLIPCTPFVLAGAISFPQQLFLVWLISMVGIVVGAFLVYSFPSFGNYDEHLEEKYPEKIAVLKEKMHGKYAFAFIIGWSFFPLVPTDAVCYVAGMAKMSFKNMISALLIGEFPLVTAYIFLGAEIGEWLRV
ncbi:MAG: VTT domain-containing protein [Arenicellales bacterium]|nr:VTT domain-containing protein [Arenicellales bacterium]